jgi:hypothetical protein
MKRLTFSTNRFAFAGLLLALSYEASFGLPSALTALLSQDCAIALPIRHEEIRATKRTRVIATLRSIRQIILSDLTSS